MPTRFRVRDGTGCGPSRRSYRKVRDATPAIQTPPGRYARPLSACQNLHETLAWAAGLAIRNRLALECEVKLRIFADNWFEEDKGLKELQKMNRLLIHPWVLFLGMILLFPGFVTMRLGEAGLRRLGLDSIALLGGFLVGSYVVGRILVAFLPSSGYLWKRPEA